jgi:hypothetical protein
MPDATCLDGFLCAAGSISPSGNEPCPKNHYCVLGTKTECPAGTYNKVTGATTADECVPCPPGFMCPDHD